MFLTLNLCVSIIKLIEIMENRKMKHFECVKTVSLSLFISFSIDYENDP